MLQLLLGGSSMQDSDDDSGFMLAPSPGSQRLVSQSELSFDCSPCTWPMSTLRSSGGHCNHIDKQSALSQPGPCSDNDDYAASPQHLSLTKIAQFRKTKIDRSTRKPTAAPQEPSIENIEPGLVIIRNFIDDTECQRIAEMAVEMGTEDGEDGFFTNKNKSGKRSLNTGEARGRIYDNADCFHPSIIAHSADAVNIARAVDPAMPNMTCTHLLLNMYTSASGLKWHRDIYENDGKSDHPVVNLCVGAACRFGIKHNDNDPERVLILRSGDCLLFGGPCRFIKHAVLDVLLDEIPSWMAAELPLRFSFTFRDAPEIIGRESEFKYFKISENLVGQDDFVVRPAANNNHQQIAAVEAGSSS